MWSGLQDASCYEARRDKCEFEEEVSELESATCEQ